MQVKNCGNAASGAAHLDGIRYLIDYGTAER